MQALALIGISLCILLSAAVSRRVQGTIITLPMVYVALGMAVGSLGLGWVEIDLHSEILRIVAELTLISVLASDASRINLRLLKGDHGLPQRLLTIGLLLTMLLGMLIAYLMFGELGIWGAAVLAVILAPTDASLGQSVVLNPLVPLRIRQTLNIESGLNDGIAMPFLLVAISLAVATEAVQIGGGFVLDALIGAIGTIVVGIAVGIVVGWLGIRFVHWGQLSGWMSDNYQKISVLGLILLTYGLAEFLGGNGFIAAFCTGAVAGASQKTEDRKQLFEHLETEVELLVLLTFVLFGAVLLPPALGNLTPKIVFYALLSLTLIRMLPVALSLIGSGVRPITTLFIGWFGPRGTASILYIFTVLDTEELIGVDLIYDIAMVTVFFSVILHGITAAPGANWYGRLMAKREAELPDMAEHQSVSKMPVRATTHISM
jgi:NhaP-type Na+/H+ or K+/H+ antiporter